jgi:hypothetical protein
MARRTVTGPDGRGNPALRVAGIALERTRLRENQNVAGARQGGGGTQGGDAAADNQEIGLQILLIVSKVIARPGAALARTIAACVCSRR